MYKYTPIAVVIPQTAMEPGSAMNHLMDLLKKHMKNLNFQQAPRRLFNDKNGVSILLRVCHKKYNPAIYAVKEKYYALSAVAALFSHLEYSMDVFYSPKTLKFIYSAGIQSTLLDFRCTSRLELITSNCNRKTLHSILSQNCVSSGGKRLIRATILEPSLNATVINDRLNIVQELIENVDYLMNLSVGLFVPSPHSYFQILLAKFPNVDSILSFCVKLSNIDAPRSTSEDPNFTEISSNSISTRKRPAAYMMTRIQMLKSAEQRLTQMISIKHCLELIPDLVKALNMASRCKPLLSFVEVLNKCDYASLLLKIEDIFNSDLKPTKSIISMTLQKTYALREGIDCLLDTTRNIFQEQIELICSKSTQYS
ncbi:MutS protein msh4 [Cichlidogyrus casuarinus]|uniref:MutS protein msh4 n=1 Tax=Cichlidogyrus casuarinus TaxID=1844966 RepID=A0ABD2QJR5_9PLAT